jgi:RNase P subunit RPR2
MPCIELQELEARHKEFNKLSLSTIASLAAGRGEFSKWQRAGRARVAFSIQMHRQTCPVCRSVLSQITEAASTRVDGPHGAQPA